MTAERLVAWRGVDDPTRVERASVLLGTTSMRAVGGAVSSAFVSSWALDVAHGWVTRSLRVACSGFGWSRTLDLRRSQDGVWTATTTAVSDADLPAPGLAEPGLLEGAVDCDLGLCPVTNTMPIRRLELLGSRVPETALVMAWVEMPSLRVLRSDQLYTSGETAGEVAYASSSRDFSAMLTVDGDGLVIDYPQLARRVD